LAAGLGVAALALVSVMVGSALAPIGLKN